jgi:polyhydroxybutyrate depolymerase
MRLYTAQEYKLLGLIFSINLLLSAHSFAQYDSIFYDNLNRTYLLHLPTGYTATKNYPLVMAMHGGTGSAFNIENQSKLSQKANNESFIVVYPEGVKGGLLNFRSWNAGWCCGYASSSTIDDVGFINALLDTLIDKYAIDTARIYATGMSNGGFMSYRLACESANRFAAIAPVAASMSMKNCSPSRVVPVIHFHSYIDTSVPWQGGIGDGISGHYNPPLDSVLHAWAAHNGCISIPDTLTNDAAFTHLVWNYCNCLSAVELYITTDGGHSWPGGNQTPIGDPVSENISATDLMWEFFQRYTLGCSVNSVSEVSVANTIQIVPNPAENQVTVLNPCRLNILDVLVYNSQGQVVLKPEGFSSFDISGLENGWYVLLFQTSEYPVVSKLIKCD